jgi:hypothetical protein
MLNSVESVLEHLEYFIVGLGSEMKVVWIVDWKL